MELMLDFLASSGFSFARHLWLGFLAGDAGNLLRDGGLFFQSLGVSFLIVTRSGAPQFIAIGIKERTSRERSDEFPCVGVLWCAEDLRRRAAFDNFAGVQNSDAMTERGDRQQVVGNIEDAHGEFAVELS